MFGHSLLIRYLLNGVVVTVLVLAGQLLVNIPAAYAFGKLSFPGREALFSLVLAALVFPRYIAAVPNFLFLSRLRLIDTYAALILPFIGSPLGVFLMRQFFRQVPWEYFDAARLDGCSLSQMLRHVLMPLIRPAVGAFAIFSIVAHWNDFFWPLVVINTQKMLTPPAGIVYFADVEAGTRWNIVMAASVVIIAPLLIAFIAARRAVHLLPDDHDAQGVRAVNFCVSTWNWLETHRRRGPAPPRARGGIRGGVRRRAVARLDPGARTLRARPLARLIEGVPRRRPA